MGLFDSIAEGFRNLTGGVDRQLLAVHALTLTIATGVDTPYQVQVGNAVPASALPLVFPGSKLHAKLGQTPNDVVVDWAAGAAT